MTILWRHYLMLALVFLSLHGIEIDCDGKELYKKVMLVAEGSLDKDAIATWLENLALVTHI